MSAAEIWHALNPTFSCRVIACTNLWLIIETDIEIPTSFFARLGGSSRVGKVVATLPSSPKPEDVVKLLSPLPRKMMLGMSTLGEQLFSRGFLTQVKKEAKKQEVSLKFVEANSNRSQQLSTAQVLFNGLYREPNAELTVFKHENKYIVARTVWVQDIQAYERRDTSRPVRDARIGMLPPKVAQVMLNITSAFLPTPHTGLMYDPFCGLGTILQEGMLMGFSMIGSDRNPRMIEATRKNIGAIKALLPLNTKDPDLFLHDATLPFPDAVMNKVSAIVTEPFLGEPLSSPLPQAEAAVYLKNLEPLYRAFFTQVAPMLPSGSPLFFILPMVRTTAGWLSFPQLFIDEIDKIGYRRQHLVPPELASYFPLEAQDALVYHRPDALVGREMRLWQKI